MRIGKYSNYFQMLQYIYKSEILAVLQNWNWTFLGEICSKCYKFALIHNKCVYHSIFSCYSYDRGSALLQLQSVTKWLGGK